ncbi:MAG: hypothetical protein ACI845_001584 [Gammaproteobacteria bacterium]|jgi:hypothetical protein
MIRLLTVGLLCLISTSAISHGMSAEDQARILNAGNFEYMYLGATHMLTGYDHLLFLFGVIFFLTNFRDILKFITAFTIGHSITLVFATLLSIKANYYLIDAVIALTVCYKAFDNLDGFKKYFQMSSPNLTWMVFIFGLIHGFGLSTRLQQLPLGDHGLLLKILSFNVGVEVGQVLALSLMLILLLGWRKTISFQRFSKASNVALMMVGGLLLLMQLHGYQHTSHPDEFPLNKDDHRHTHEDMQQELSPLSGYSKKLDFNQKSLPEGAPDNQIEQQEKQPEEHSHDGEKSHSH